MQRAHDPRVPEPWPVEVEIAVPWRDVDGAGHVNHAVYFSYFESARAAAFLAHFGWRAGKDYRIIVARAEADYVAQASMHDRLLVRTWPTRIGTSSFDLAYEALDASSRRVVARGRTVQVWFDYAKNAKEPIPSHARAKLEAGLPTRA